MWKLLAKRALGALPSIVMWIIARASAAAVAVALVLVGCVPTTSPASPAPRPSTTPVFATEAEALAAATKAYAAYSEASDSVTFDGGKRPDRIAKFVSPEQLKRELKGFLYYKVNSLSSRGNSKFDSVRLESLIGHTKSDFDLSVYLCSDISSIRLFDSTGADVTPLDLPKRSPLQVGFEVRADSREELIVSRSESWTGNDFCAD